MSAKRRHCLKQWEKCGCMAWRCEGGRRRNEHVVQLVGKGRESDVVSSPCGSLIKI
jgi:hypothetical protein